MRRKWFFIKILLFAFLFSCSGDEIKITKIIIEYVDKDIVTPIRIDCNDFDLFSDSKKSKTITRKEKLTDFVNHLDGIIHDTIGPDGDIRTKILVYFDTGLCDTFCISYHPDVILYNGEKMKFNIGFVKLCDSYILEK